MTKDMYIGMGVRKGTVVSFVPTLFGYFLGIPSVYVSSFLFVTLLSKYEKEVLPVTIWKQISRVST